MSSQITALAAQFADLGGPVGIAARLIEPSALTLIAIGVAGVVVGRFLIASHRD